MLASSSKVRKTRPWCTWCVIPIIVIVSVRPDDKDGEHSLDASTIPKVANYVRPDSGV